MTGYMASRLEAFLGLNNAFCTLPDLKYQDMRIYGPLTVLTEYIVEVSFEKKMDDQCKMILGFTPEICYFRMDHKV